MKVGVREVRSVIKWLYFDEVYNCRTFRTTLICCSLYLIGCCLLESHGYVSRFKSRVQLNYKVYVRARVLCKLAPGVSPVCKDSIIGLCFILKG